METDKNRFMTSSEEVRRVLLVPGLGVAAIAIAVALSSSQTEEIFFQLFLSQDLPGAVAYALMILAAVSLARSTDSERIGTLVESLGRKTLWLAVASIIGLSIATVTIYHNLPLALDEYSQSFQAKIFAEGRIWVDYSKTFVQYMIYGDFLDSFFKAETGRVVTGYWPGFSLLLAPFMALELPWLLNPLLAAGTLLLLRHLAQQLLPGTAAGGWAVFFALASPQFTVAAISYYSMSAHLFLNLLFAALVLKPSEKRLLLAGLVGSLALVLHQPLPHLAFAAPWIGWLALASDVKLHPNPGRIKRLLLLGLGYLPLSLILGVGWKLL